MRKSKEKQNEDVLRVIKLVLNQESWEHGDSSRFARILTDHTKERISRASVYNWLMKEKGIPKRLEGAITTLIETRREDAKKRLESLDSKVTV